MVKKFIGKIYWITPSIYSIPEEAKTDTNVCEIIRAIFIDNKLKLDWINGGIKLETVDNINFQGVFNCEYDGSTITGGASGQLYNNKNGCLLIGKWVEEGIHFTWIAELKKVDKFLDEKK